MDSTKIVVDLLKILVLISSGAFLVASNLHVKGDSCLLKATLIFFFITVFFCGWCLMKITGLVIENETKRNKQTILVNDGYLRIGIGISIFACLLGGIFLLIYVW